MVCDSFPNFKLGTDLGCQKSRVLPVWEMLQSWSSARSTRCVMAGFLFCLSVSLLEWWGTPSKMYVNVPPWVFNRSVFISLLKPKWKHQITPARSQHWTFLSALSQCCGVWSSQITETPRGSLNIPILQMNWGSEKVKWLSPSQKWRSPHQTQAFKLLLQGCYFSICPDIN